MGTIAPHDWIAFEEFELVLVSNFLAVMDQRNAFCDERKRQHRMICIAINRAGRAIPGVLVMILRVEHAIGIERPGGDLFAEIST